MYLLDNVYKLYTKGTNLFFRKLSLSFLEQLDEVLSKSGHYNVCEDPRVIFFQLDSLGLLDFLCVNHDKEARMKHFEHLAFLTSGLLLIHPLQLLQSLDLFLAESSELLNFNDQSCIWLFLYVRYFINKAVWALIKEFSDFIAIPKDFTFDIILDDIKIL